ncbi:MAG: DUF115 domain-containing protein [Spirochaetales bacterium]|nr:DUF115 domain-containing protein [Spirochaetales bacterium]
MDRSAGEPLLVDTGRGFSVTWQGRHLYSSRDPRVAVLRRINDWLPQEDTLYLIPSPLLGYGFRELKEKLPPGSFLLGVELFQELMALSQPYLPSDIFDGIHSQIIRTDSIPALCRFVSELGLDRFKRCRRLDLTGGSRLAPDFYGNLEQELGRLIFQHWQTRASLVRMGPLWFRNICRNFTLFAGKPSVRELSVDGTIMLCGAGESLEKSVPLIRRHRENLFLCAVDTAYPALIEAGIVPDAVFNLDGQFYNFYDFYKHGEKALHLISDITAYPGSLRLKGIKPWYFSSRFAENRLLSNLEAEGLLPCPLPPLGSVGVSALFLCTLLGEGPYLFTGLDFSYMPGKSHARGTVFHQLFLNRTNRLLPDGGLTELSLKRPARRLAGRNTERSLRSDTVLEGYYRSFLEIAGTLKEQAYQLNGDYPHLGVPALNEEEMTTLMEKTGKPLVSEAIPRGSDCRSEVFLRREKKSLGNIILGWERFEAEGDSRNLENALLCCDYTYLTVGVDKTSHREIYFTQAVKNARTYLRLLEQQEPLI